ncbi:Receptor-type tyrosine-protein phosphatase epsilon [Anabarilius grahami]|uniref:protein-tyrosine-phosphatase n=1 Tax=Anabarilius grahami TaxID=495550 RepID=A0A3N0Y5V1_ANAGA|nr:Receptor-type tyrosine-protein phosphatase epsilon [Anabarilius grahami]
MMVLFLVSAAIISNSSSHGNLTTESPAPQGSHVLASGLVTSLLLLIFLLLIAYILRFREQRKDLVASVDKKLPNGFLEDQEQMVVLLPRSPSPSKRYFPIPLDSLEEEFRLRMADDGKLFREEFNSLPCGFGCGTFEEASREENREKNRYPNILPCPKPETVGDFWRMVWEQKSTTIVMLTNTRERKEEKCYQYWPEQGCWIYGCVKVAMEDVTVLVDYTIRKFCVQHEKCYQYWPEQGCWIYGCVKVAMEDVTVLVDYTIRKFCVQHHAADGCRPPRLVTQLHFTSWPDFGVPLSPIGMLKFLKKVKTVNPAHAGPIIVHCSAGVGRTGTFVVIDAMMDMMQSEGRVDVFGFVSRIRKQRCQLIQTDMQYSFIYQALLEHYLFGDTELDIASLEGHLHKLHNTHTHMDRVGLEEEFRKLTNVRIMKENMRTGNLPANMRKNRVLQIIPYDFNRVILSMKRGQEFTDYINASFIDGYRQKDYFIATQAPLAHTVQDFWRMVWERKCHSIVMLTELKEREQEKCVRYWPAEGSVSFGEYVLELKRDALCETFSIRDMLLSYASEKQTRLVRQFHFHGWPEIGIPSDGKGMIDIIAAVQKQQQQSGNNPIVVHCSAGAGRTGTFIALSNILERVKAEGLLDVFQTVKSLRTQRPHMVQTVEQYDFCYRVVQDFVDIYSDYANFK